MCEGSVEGECVRGCVEGVCERSVWREYVRGVCGGSM